MFWKEKSVEDVVHNWADGTSHTSIIAVEAAKVSCQGTKTVRNWCRSCQGTLVVHTITPCGHSLKMWDQMKACFLCFLSL
jgi:RecJ-like exonuclease